MEFAEITFHAMASRPCRLGQFAGTTLRGALGAALKRLCCHQRLADGDCDRCLVRDRCVYAVVFEGVPPADREIMRKYPRIPHPFVLCVEADTPQEFNERTEMRFGIRLFGRAIDSYPFIVQAVRDMLTRGLGRDRVEMDLLRAEDGQTNIYVRGDTTVSPPRTESLFRGKSDSQGPSEICARLLSPLRLQVNGAVDKKPALGTLMRAAVRRLKVLCAFYGAGTNVDLPSDLLDAADRCTILQCSYRPWEVRRYSSRQERRMAFDTVIGGATYDWPDPSLDPRPLMRAAEILHVGKGTAFGFGRIAFEAIYI